MLLVSGRVPMTEVEPVPVVPMTEVGFQGNRWREGNNFYHGLFGLNGLNCPLVLWYPLYIYNDSLLKVDIIPNIRGFDPATYFRSKMVRHEERARMLTHQWFKCQTFRLWGVAYLVGKVMIELEFHGPLAEWKYLEETCFAGFGEWSSQVNMEGTCFYGVFGREGLLSFSKQI